MITGKDTQDILKKAVRKAIDGGWMHEHIPELVLSEDHWSVHPYQMLIYRHDFAKALWGEYGYIPEARYVFRYKSGKGVEKTRVQTIVSAVSPWQYHLQQLVITDDPIQYLADNI